MFEENAVIVGTLASKADNLVHVFSYEHLRNCNVKISSGQNMIGDSGQYLPVHLEITISYRRLQLGMKCM